MKSAWKIDHEPCKSLILDTLNLTHYHICLYGHFTRRNGDKDKTYLGWALACVDIAIPFVKKQISNKVRFHLSN